MILSTLKAAASPYMMWIKIAGAVILVGAIVWQVHAYNERRRAEGAADIKASYDKGYAAALANARAKEAADRQMWQTRSESYEQQIAKLDNDLKHRPVTRLLCRNPAPSGSSAGSAEATREPEKADSLGLDRKNGEDHERDIGPELDAYARDAQAMAIQCAEIQRGYLELTEPSK